MKGPHSKCGRPAQPRRESSNLSISAKRSASEMLVDLISLWCIRRQIFAPWGSQYPAQWLRRIVFCGILQMPVNIHRCRDLTVSQPLLYLFHRNTVSQQKRCAGMAKIVKTNMPHIMFLKQFPKSRRHIIRLNQIADYIDADITQVFSLL